MGLPVQAVNLAPEKVAELNQQLSTMRHNINNNLALIVAAVELIRRKPDLAPRMAENIAAQPDRIMAELRKFSEQFDEALGITRETPPTVG
jgi:hypothetical protein